ncbi:DUF2339 domain-containing protein [Cupriavidus basilensis]|uniref:DUF2339 domain-containing protein n=1 Tax=Cupriavidus basilensis TaxID=68895 RepID=UPI0028414367|nr:DUF2339 domain-containing protein [Cupriavidus basilensis]MDR3383923.1 DUF2339 domain-containing protein [Cupriavidus basilensis]
MRWIFGVIGLVLGMVAAGFGGALTGAVLGFGFGWMVSDRPTRPPGEGEAQGAAAAPLEARVLRLEQELSTLRRELASLRGESTLAPSATSALGAAPGTVAASEFPSFAPAASAAVPSPSIPAAIPLPIPVEAAPAPISTPAPAAVPAPAPASVRHIEPPLSSTLGPGEPDFVERAISAARGWLLGGNSVVRVGILILFFGVAFLLKYASDNAMLPVEFRLAGVAAGAVLLLLAGWRLRERRAAYALVLQGGGVGVLYLTVFAATKLYGLLPAAAAFPLMVAICALAGGLAVLQNAPALAFTGSAGGFLAPVLISTGGGSHVMLFSYYALLNASIFAIAWFRAWRQLNLLGFAFTFGIGTAWGALNYRPELLATTEPFLILFFLMYTGIALRYALRRQVSLKDYVDGTLVFGTPLLAMGLQAALVRDIPFAMAWSAVALAAFYLGLAAWLAARRDRLGLLFEAVLALGVIFASLAVPLAFDGRTTSAVWAVEGAAVVWVGVRQQRRLALASGLLLQLAAGAAFAAGSLFDATQLAWPVLNSRYVGTLLLAVAGVFSGWRLHGRPEARAWSAPCAPLGLGAALWGLLWWLGGGVIEIQHWHGVRGWQVRALLDMLAMFMVLSAWLAHVARRVLAWPLASVPAQGMAPLLAVLAVLSCIVPSASPLLGFGALAWLIVFGAAWLLLWRQQDDERDALLAPMHALLFWTVCMLLSTEAYWRLRAYVPQGAWSWSAWAYGYGGLLALLSAWGWRLRWPVGRFQRAYLLYGALPLVALLWLWSIASVSSDGDAAPLSYLPLLNPLDVAQLLAMLAVALWQHRLAAAGLATQPRVLGYAAIATVLLWLNAVLLRTLHHWAGVPYTLEGLAGSTLVQASLSIFWTVLALIAMVAATRRGSRALWFAGGALLGVTVVKLFLFDLSFVKGIERIISFIGVGVLLLLIGYFSPLPPKQEEAT